MVRFVKKHIVVIIIICFIVAIVFFMEHKESNEAETELLLEQPVEIAEESEEIETDVRIIVDIKGEVAKPGVYEVERDTRVVDVIREAGGFTKTADENQINLAQKVHDEMVVIVPKEGDPLINISSVEATATSSSSQIRINQATLDEIQQLNGIGPSKAQAIIDYREEHGLFQQPEDLLQVNGIGEKTFENIKDDIIIP